MEIKAKNMKKQYPCIMQPNNCGLDCISQGRRDGIPKKDCEHCGWNPTVAKERHKYTLEHIDEITRRKKGKK